MQIGAFEQSDTGMWHLDIGGGVNDFDRLSLTSIAVHGGILDLGLIDGYVPVLDQTLNILLAPGGVTGEFADVMQPTGMPAGLMFDIVYSATQVQLQVVAAPNLPGDFDLDGDVDGRDFLVWQGNPSVGDLADWQGNYGAGSLTANVAVPEPGASLLLMWGCCSIFRGRIALPRAKC